MEQTKLEYSSIVEVAEILSTSLFKLGVELKQSDAERISWVLNRAYRTRNRIFHNIDHAIGVGENCSPLGQIAALFHDVVYIQVDRSRIKELRETFGVFDPKDSLELTINEDALSDPLARALTVLFGFSLGQKIGPFSGINEFLSAWFAIQTLEPFLSKNQLLHIAACIESTIPFRGEEKNPTTFERLVSNLYAAAALLNCEMSENEIENAVFDAVRISNNDIRGFGLEEPEEFIQNSWALLYESNPSLQTAFFSIKQYREPLQRLERFLSGLTPSKIFAQYKEFPNTATLDRLLLGARSNLEVGVQYIKAKLLDTAILEAFADITGGDCPLELFTGPKPKRRESSVVRIEHFLKWDKISYNQTDKDFRVIRLLNDGRTFRSRFDIKTALFASYLYQSLDIETFEKLYGKATQFFNREIEAHTFLSLFPDELINSIGETLIFTARTRSAAIKTYLATRTHRIRRAG